jgi:hypothetical protein
VKAGIQVYLDKPSSGEGKAPKGRYPHQQIRDYLNESEHIQWGILTNGKEWRLYSKEGRSSKFFEIDLEECLEDIQRFKYFYALFRPVAFIKDRARQEKGEFISAKTVFMMIFHLSSI